MKISANWLKEFVKLQDDAQGIGRKLGSGGVEVASVTPSIPAFEKVCVGQVKSLEKHPSADKLNVCQVDIGDGKLHQIVCGAPNVQAGMKAPVILPGGKLPDGTVIKQAALRGVDSSGMLCSARELGLSEEASGLFALPADAPVGKDLREYLGGGDWLIEIEITPNRGDCLSILGVARELAALYGKPLEKTEVPPVKAAIKDVFPAEIQAEKACPVFATRVIKGLRADAVTPLWMRERLRSAGLKPIHPAVDVTQYVMLELGQPMHAYDLKRLDGGLTVRMAKAGEKTKLLNGQVYEAQHDVLVIADKSRLQGFAGIMGGGESNVTAGTTDVLLEAAFFTPAAISGRPRRMDLLTDAAYRFERGVDPTGQARAIERATQLILEIAGGQPGPVSVVTAEATRFQGAPIRLRRARLAALLGISVPDKEVEGILTRLGFMVKADKEGWMATAPSHRFDIEIEEDLIEEVGRVHGYDRIPALQYPSRQGMAPLPEARVDLRRLRQVLVERGYQEVVTYSFVDAGLQAQVYGSNGMALPLANPITADMAEMRMGLWPGLLKVLQYNLNRQQDRVRVFETGLIFYSQADDIKQENIIAGLVSGPEFPLQWGETDRPVDFADLKGDIEALLRPAGAAGRLEVQASALGALHPGQSARLMLDGRELGWMGSVHPRLVKALDLPQGALVFEIRLEMLLGGKIPAFEPISRFPAVRRDLAVVVEEKVTAGQLLAMAREAAGSLLQEARIFDIYRGPGIDSGRKSVALGLILQDSSRTLTDEDADGTMQRVADRLRRDLGATIRD
ncbi:MAG TPA: phenylalanine--tRNA ligase subunit beta [Gammaproteobacteria bacterium]